MTVEEFLAISSVSATPQKASSCGIPVANSVFYSRNVTFAENVSIPLVPPLGSIQVSPKTQDHFERLHSIAEVNSPEPSTYQEATHPNNPEREKWLEGTVSEIKSLLLNKTWEVVPRPYNRRTITAKWVFKRKRNALRKITRWKARLVARGYAQEKGVDYIETFSPVVRMQTLRLLLAIALVLGLKVHQMDVETAFLNGILKEIIYMEAPEGVTVPPGHVLKLQRCLYGLKQAGREWNLRFRQFLLSIGFRQFFADPALFIQETHPKDLFC